MVFGVTLTGKLGPMWLMYSRDHEANHVRAEWLENKPKRPKER
jgi:hypothetical protein